MSSSLLAVTVVVAVGTWGIRASFLSVAHRAGDLSPLVLAVLRQIPPAALAALVLPGLLRPEVSYDPWNARLGGALVALVLALWRRNDLATPLVGGLAVAALLLQLG
ncbi:MAG TPA: AzlD domain-containing protein [Acidimicrobiales bacterium]|jgi:branched-subunit amino acid transport protein